MNIDKIRKPIDKIIAGITVTMMVLLVVCVVWQVFSRYVLLKPSTSTDETARFLMIWIGLLGAAYAVGLQKHLAIDLLIQSLSEKKKCLITILINLTVMAFSLVVIVFGGTGLVLKVLESHQVSAALHVPMGYVYLILPISGIIMVGYSALYTIENAVKYKNIQD